MNKKIEKTEKKAETNIETKVPKAKFKKKRKRRIYLQGLLL